MPDFITLLSQFMDGYAVVIGIGFSMILIHFFPKLGESGTIWNRLMVLVPLICAILTVLIRDYLLTSTPIELGTAIVKGLCSGFAAVYISRSVKVSILGK